MSDAALETRLEELRKKRDELERKLREGRAVVAERVSALGPRGAVGRNVPSNILAELRSLEKDARALKELGIAIAVLKRALEDGSGVGTYREGGDGVAAIVRKAHGKRDELEATLRKKEQRLLERYIAANVPRIDGPSKAGIAFFVFVLVAAGIEAAVLIGWPWCLLAAVPIGILGRTAVRELREDLRARKSPQSLIQFDSRKVPKELEAEQSALRVESERLDALREEADVLERVFEEKEEDVR